MSSLQRAPRPVPFSLGLQCLFGATVARTHLTEHLEDDEQESLLYDSRFPSDAVLLDNLPGKAHVGADGRLQGGSFFGAVGVLILPGLSVLLTALTILVMTPDV